MARTEAQEAVYNLERMRRILKGDEIELLALEAEIAKTEIGRRLKEHIEALAAKREYRTQAEDKVRAFALAEFDETGVKSGLCGGACGVRVNTELDYDAKEAFAWAIDHRLAVRLDVAAFEKIVKASPSAYADFVVVKQVPQATIASDLAKVMESWSHD